MNLEKAIEILKELSVPGSPNLNPDDFDAIKLGIEALNTILEMHHHPFPEGVIRLPGETEE